MIFQAKNQLYTSVIIPTQPYMSLLKYLEAGYINIHFPKNVLDIPNVQSKVTAEAREVNGYDDIKGNPKNGINTEKRSTIRSNSKGKRRRERVRERENDRYIVIEGGSTSGSDGKSASDGGRGKIS